MISDAAIATPDDDLLEMSPQAKALARSLATVESPFTLGVYGEWGEGKTSQVELLLHYLKEQNPRGFLDVRFRAWPNRAADELWRTLVVQVVRRLLGLPDLQAADRCQLPPPLEGSAGDDTGSGRAAPSPAEARYELVLERLEQVPAPTARSTERDAGSTGASSAERIAAWNSARCLLEELFHERAEGRRVYVFIDDLDRCMPDQALDFLESCQLFFDGVRDCVFIVAVDPDVISQGLKVRHRHGLTSTTDGWGKRLDRRGAAYVEKLIQMGVRVPPHGPNRIHKLVASLYPEWSAASDIIHAAAAGNPRRVKQYCHQLDYVDATRRQAEEAEATDLDPFAMEAFDWAVELRRRYPEAADQLLAWSGDRNDLVARLRASQQEEWWPMIERWWPVLSRDPLPANGKVEFLVASLTIADLQPDQWACLAASCPAFLGIVESYVRGRRPSADQLLNRDLERLRDLRDELPEAAIAEGLAALAGPVCWPRALQAIERDAERREDIAPAAARDDGGGDAAERALRESLSRLDPATLRRLILEPPRLSQILPATVAYDLQHAARSSVDVRELVDSDSPELDSVRHHLELYRTVAGELMVRRSVAKMLALDHRWKELGQRYRVDGSLLLKLESALGASAEETEDLTDRDRDYLGLDTYQKDRDFRRLTRLRPYFGAILNREVSRYFAHTAAPPAEPTAPTPPGAQAVDRRLGYADIRLRVTQPHGDDDGRFRVELSGFGFEAEAHDFELSAAEVKLLTEDGPSERAAPPTPEEQKRQRALRSAATASGLTKVGAQLLDKLFGDRAKERLLRDLYRRSPLRLLLDLPDSSHLKGLPWEAMYARSKHASLGLSRTCSVVRYLSDTQFAPVIPRVAPPLRVLVAVANPKGVPPVDVEREKSYIADTLLPATRAGVAELRFVQPATRQQLFLMLNRLRPHIFHFIGHGKRGGIKKESSLVLEGDEGRVDLVSATDMFHPLEAAGVSLAVLNACDTAADASHESVRSVAGSLVHRAVPAAVATTKVVADVAAVVFTRGFYRALGDGWPVERALVEGRKEVHLEGLDWSPYVLLSSTADLEELLPPLPVPDPWTV